MNLRGDVRGRVSFASTMQQKGTCALTYISKKLGLCRDVVVWPWSAKATEQQHTLPNPLNHSSDTQPFASGSRRAEPWSRRRHAVEVARSVLSLSGHQIAMDLNAQAGGTGSRFSSVVIILTGVSSLFATLVTVV
jgi:hypothetical protein